MKRGYAFLSASLLVILLITGFSGCEKKPKEEVKELEQGTSLHYIYPDYNVGDVHPYYDEKTSTWYMFYLKPGDYGSRLLVSKDKIRWEPKDINFEYNVAPTKYYVLGVLKDGDKYRSYYGNSFFHGSSESNDLLTWRNSPTSYKVPTNTTMFPVGARDPYVFFDPDENVYRCVSTAYRTNKEWKSGDTMDCSIAFSSTTENNLTSWNSSQKELIRFPDGYKGQPECSQMFKMGNRWYLLASLYGRTNNGVGRPTYWTGDEGKKILENDWQSKSENSLDGDDLCAAQVASDGSKTYLWGWIEKKWQGGDWGGHISLAHEVYAMPDGSLATRLDETVAQKIRGRELANLAETTLQSGNSAALEGTYSRVDLASTLQLSNSAVSFALGDVKVHINAKNNVISVTKDENDPMQYFASYRVPEGLLNGDVSVHIIAEDDIIEVFVNDRYSLCARVSDSLQNKSIQVVASDGSVTVKNAVAYRLKYLEEIQ